MEKLLKAKLYLGHADRTSIVTATVTPCHIASWAMQIAPAWVQQQ